jgi:hypothetical protein
LDPLINLLFRILHLDWLKDLSSIPLQSDDEHEMDNTVLEDYPSASDFDHVDALIHQHSWARETLKLLDMVRLHTTATSSLSRWHLGEKDYHSQKFLERAGFQWMRHTLNTADKKMMPLDALFSSQQKHNGDQLSTEEVEILKT